MIHALFSRHAGRTLLVAALLAICSASASAQPKAPAASSASSISAILANQQILLAKLDALGLKSLQEYAFAKFKIAPAEQTKYHLKYDLDLLSAGTWTSSGQRLEVINRIAANIEQVKASVQNDPTQLMNVAAKLVTNGVAGELAKLEYWGEIPTTQADLAPIAKGVSDFYVAAIEQIEARRKKVEDAMGANPSPAQIQEWNGFDALKLTAEYNKAFNDYAVVLSFDRASPQRAEIATKALAVLAEYDNVDQGVQNPVRIQMAKLRMARGDKDQEDYTKAREIFDKVLADTTADWTAKYEATYFKTVAAVQAKDLQTALKELEAMRAWETANPPPAGKGFDTNKLEANASVLEYRCHLLKFEMTRNKDDQQEAFNELTGLMKKQPAAAPFIAKLLIDQMGKISDYTKVGSALQLDAYQTRADSEMARPAPDKEPEKEARKEILNSGLLAAREAVRRNKEVPNSDVTKEAVEKAIYRMGWYLGNLGDKGAAAQAFVVYLETYRRTPLVKEWPARAFAEASALLNELRADWGQEAVKGVLLRFFDLGTDGQPFAQFDLAMDYGRILVMDNYAELTAWRSGGGKDDAQRQKIAKSAAKAVVLLQKYETTKPAKEDVKRLVYARYYRLLGLKQQVDVSAEKQEGLIKQVGEVAKSLKSAIQQLLQKPDLEATVRESLKQMNAQTILLTAQLIWDADKEQKKPETAKQVLKTLEDFEKTAEGFEGADRLVNDVMSLRIQAMLTTGDATGASEVVLQLLKKDPQRAIRIVYTLLKMLEADLDKAMASGNRPLAQQILAARAQLTPFLVKQVQESSDPKVNKLLYPYLRFDAYTKFQAGLVADDPAERAKWFDESIKRDEELLKPENQELYRKQLDPDSKADPKYPDPNVMMQMAQTYFAWEKWEKCQPLATRLLQDKKLGQPLIFEKGVDGSPQLTYNESFWQAEYMKLRSSANICANPPAGFDAPALKKELVSEIQESYIVYARPGGPKYFAEFEKLRQELVPGWVPPAHDLKTPATGVTQPASQP